MGMKGLKITLALSAKDGFMGLQGGENNASLQCNIRIYVSLQCNRLIHVFINDSGVCRRGKQTLSSNANDGFISSQGGEITLYSSK